MEEDFDDRPWDSSDKGNEVQLAQLLCRLDYNRKKGIEI